jgi:hypothetical protein
MDSLCVWIACTCRHTGESRFRPLSESLKLLDSGRASYRELARNDV